MLHIQPWSDKFQGLALTNVCAEEVLMGPEVWGKERVRRERQTERGGGLLSSKDLSDSTR